MIDLRSDTVTHPTQKMREAMMTAAVGDDVYGDDPTVIKLETLAARVTGKEAALFVCSGTMGNQLAIMSHTRLGEEIITGKMSHIIQHEAGAYARLAGVSAMMVDTAQNGYITAQDVKNNIRAQDIHHPVTTLLCLENPMSDGAVVPLEKIKEAADAAHKAGLKVHMDGARLFNAAAALSLPASEVVKEVDSVMFCLSKGLCAPIGSMLCGKKDLIDRARRNRKVLGGGLRQAGVLAACGLIAIEEMSNRLREDHENAIFLAQMLSDFEGIQINLDHVQTNMVWAQVTKPGFEDADFVAYLKERGVLINGDPGLFYRFVTHHDVSKEDLESAANLIGIYLLS